jgi:hypothetical protein
MKPKGLEKFMPGHLSFKLGAGPASASLLGNE